MKHDICFVVAMPTQANALRELLPAEGYEVVVVGGSTMGKRFDTIVIATDLTDATGVDLERNRQWYDDQLQTRLVPDGHILNLGRRRFT